MKPFGIGIIGITIAILGAAIATRPPACETMLDELPANISAPRGSEAVCGVDYAKYRAVLGEEYPRMQRLHVLRLPPGYDPDKFAIDGIKSMFLSGYEIVGHQGRMDNGFFKVTGRVSTTHERLTLELYRRESGEWTAAIHDQ